jgi:AcrR family transcriptional regulator
VAREAASKPNRAGRRRRETRGRLIDAARRTIASRGGLEAVPIGEITEAADVAIGSFYNHFESKEQLFTAVVTDTVEQHGERLDEVTAEIADIAEACSVGIRLTVRMVEDDPIWGAFVVHSGLYMAQLQSSLLHRLAGHLHHGFETGRFASPDRVTSLALVGGAVFGAMVAKRLDVVPGDADSLVAQQLLELLGLPAGEAAEIARRPLPDLPKQWEQSAEVDSRTDAIANGSAIR